MFVVFPKPKIVKYIFFFFFEFKYLFLTKYEIVNKMIRIISIKEQTENKQLVRFLYFQMWYVRLSTIHCWLLSMTELQFYRFRLFIFIRTSKWTMVYLFFCINSLFFFIKICQSHAHSLSNRWYSLPYFIHYYANKRNSFFCFCSCFISFRPSQIKC